MSIYHQFRREGKYHKAMNSVSKFRILLCGGQYDISLTGPPFTASSQCCLDSHDRPHHKSPCMLCYVDCHCVVVQIQHPDLYMSRAMPKSPILATLSGPGQVSRQFLAAMSLKYTGSFTL